MWLWLSVAGATEIGSSVGFGFGAGDGLGDIEGYGGLGFAPTLDLRFSEIALQIHAIDTLAAAFDERLFLGANLYVGVLEKPITGALFAVLEPGASLDLLSEPSLLSVGGECRFGAVARGEGSVGVYVVPAAGIVAGGGEAHPYFGGTLQISVGFSL